MQSLIRWNRSDYAKLRSAITQFNKLLNELNLDYAPETITYSDVKSRITTRNELNRILKALKSANESNLTETRSFESGQVVSKWEHTQITRARGRAFRNLERERQGILQGRQSIGMGDERLSEIHAIEQSFIDLENRKGYEFKRLKQRIFNVGRTDLQMKKAVTFRENFYTALEGLSSYDNYEVLKKELDKIKNPLKFYDYVKQSPVLMDIFLWYKEKDTTHYGGFQSNEEAFNTSLLFHLGIDPSKVKS